METDITSLDQEKIERAVRYINDRVEKASGSLIEIGQYLFTNFFQSDIAVVRQRNPQKDVSLRKLATHPDLNFSYSGLSRAVNLAVQERLLGFGAMSQEVRPSHKILLLNVPDLDEKKSYIDKIIKNNLSVRRFSALLTEDGFITPRGGSLSEGSGKSKSLPSSEQFYVNVFREIHDIDTDLFSAMPQKRIQETYDWALKAKQKIEEIIALIDKSR